MSKELNSTLHNFNFKDFKYVYCVVSRRLEGLSVGINPVNYCNWDCVYCDAPRNSSIQEQVRAVDLDLLRKELDFLLEQIVNGVFCNDETELKSITIAGNGEPTLSDDLGNIIKIIGELRKKYAIGPDVKTLLITNGSCLGEEKLQEGIRILATINGEIWFKIDSITARSIEIINRCKVNFAEVINVIEKVSKICPLYIQTCFFKLNNNLPTQTETKRYLSFLKTIKEFIRGVFLYTASRKPFADSEISVEPASLEYLNKLGQKIEKLGIPTKIHK